MALMPVEKRQWFDNSGNPLVAGKVYFYAAGSSTPLPVYTDYTLATAHAQPVVLDSAGRASVYLAAAVYKVVVKTSADVTLYTQDYVADTGTLGVDIAALVSVAVYGAVSDGVTNDNVAIQAAIAAGHKRLFLPANTLWQPTADLVPANVEFYGGNWLTTVIKSSNPTTAWISIGAYTVLHDIAIYDRFGTDTQVMLGGANGPRPARKISNVSGQSMISNHWKNMDTFVGTGGPGVDQQGIVVLGQGTGDAIFVGASDTSVGVRVTSNNTQPASAGTGILAQNYGTGQGVTVRGEVGSAPAANTGHLHLVSASNSIAQAIAPSVDTTTDFLYVSTTKTAGQVFSLFHNTSSFTGSVILANMAVGSGAFSGYFTRFLKNSVEQFSVNGAGLVNLVGGQIAYPSTQVPSADANTLDDYREVAWTPAIGGSGGQSGQVYSAQLGRYIKVGKKMTCWGRIVLTTLGTVTGNVLITGLPKTVLNDPVLGTVRFGYFAALTSTVVWLSGYTLANTTTALLQKMAAAATATTTLAQADLSATTDLLFEISYEASA